MSVTFNNVTEMNTFMDIGHCISNENYELLYKSPEPVIKSVQKN